MYIKKTVLDTLKRALHVAIDSGLSGRVLMEISESIAAVETEIAQTQLQDTLTSPPPEVDDGRSLGDRL